MLNYTIITYVMVLVCEFCVCTHSAILHTLCAQCLVLGRIPRLHTLGAPVFVTHCCALLLFGVLCICSFTGLATFVVSVFVICRIVSSVSDWFAGLLAALSLGFVLAEV